MLDQLKSTATEFFNLPHEEKLLVDKKKSAIRRGYFSQGEEVLGYSKDIKEGYDLGEHFEGQENGRGLNQYPNLAGFRETVDSVHSRLLELAHQILRAFTISLDLPRDHFDSPDQHRGAILRLLKYPPCDKSLEGSSDMSCGPHTDYGYITLLHQDSIGGLEVLNSKKQWIKAVPIEGSLVVNIGDLFAMMSNDRYVSTTASL
eukprot:gene1406-1622_t